ncbi:hypothetical protein FM124_00070 [Pediococcus acidilactici]|nr:hypothetical protein FM124_00070 [Pediococcus acidilactici]
MATGFTVLVVKLIFKIECGINVQTNAYESSAITHSAWFFICYF